LLAQEEYLSPDQNNKWQAKDNKKIPINAQRMKLAYINAALRCIFMKGAVTVACIKKKKVL